MRGADCRDPTEEEFTPGVKGRAAVEDGDTLGAAVEIGALGAGLPEIQGLSEEAVCDEPVDVELVADGPPSGPRCSADGEDAPADTGELARGCTGRDAKLELESR